LGDIEAAGHQVPKKEIDEKGEEWKRERDRKR
jgi:hypothetical protein